MFVRIILDAYKNDIINNIEILANQKPYDFVISTCYILITAKFSDDYLINMPSSVESISSIMENIPSQTELLNRINLLEQQTQFAHDLLNHITEAIVVIRLNDAIIIDTNEAMIDLFGYDKDELIGSPLPSLHTDYNFYEHILEQLQNQAQWQSEVLTVDKQQSAFSVNVSATYTQHPIHDAVLVLTFNNIEEKYVYRKQYLSLVDSIPQLIYRSDLEGKLTFVNHAFQQGIDLPFTDIIGRKLHQLYPYIAADEIIQDDQRIIQTRQSDQQLHTLLNPATGDLIHLDVTKVPILDDDNTVIGIQGIIENVTQKTNIENKLKASETSLQRLIQQIPMGIQVFDKNGLCIDANQSHLDIFGTSYDAIVGKYNIFKDDLAQDTTTVHGARLALQGDTVSIGDITFNFDRGDIRFTDTQQQERIINVTIFPMFDHHNQVIGFVGLNQDVTHRKKREEQLRISEARYRAVVQDQNEMISRYLPDGTYTFVNRAFCDFVERDEEQIVGQKWQTLVSDDAQKAIEAKIGTISQGNPTVFHEEKQIKDDGEIKWVHWIDRGIFDDEGNIVEYQGIGIDITKKKNLEQEQFALELEQERMKILSNFVIQASHEFRTPLSIINSSAFAMTRMADVKQREARSQKINKQVKRITDLIESMTIMSRIDSNTPITQLNKVDINKLIDIAYSRIISKKSDNIARIDLQLADTPLLLNIKDKEFVRIIELIVDNAIKHTSADDTIDITTYADAKDIIITIADTGVGMSDEIRKHVFDRFFKADTTGKTIGLGLGLPIARGIIRQFGGSIALESNIGQGTTVTITFPQITLD